MPKYCIISQEVLEHHYIIDAVNEKEARGIVLSGDCAPEDTESYSQTIDDVMVAS